MDNWVEYTATALGIANVILAARGNIWCWLAGIVSAAMYVYLNFGWQLYFDMVLQLFYVLAGFYGWWKWTQKQNGDQLPIIRWGLKQQMPLLLGGVVTTLVLGSIAFYYTRSYLTFYDAALTIFSFIATWMMAKKIIENWVWWIVIDTAGIGLYLLKDAQPTAFLYLALTIGAVYALYNWRRMLSLQPKTTAP